MKLLSQEKALARLKRLKDDFRETIALGYEHAAKSCERCETPGACCLDAHFVNVRISRLESVAIKRAIDELAAEHHARVSARISDTIERFGLDRGGEILDKTYACPLYERGVGCLVHKTAKPLPCIAHACYENAADLPPDALLDAQEIAVDQLNANTYGKPSTLLPLPIAIRNAGL